ncbi:hypothetical protein [Motilibacter aurantiacus]|uniref:hypothetical protein n=1 Tax=Motilibacter aurantiacus TaxID=2714955 RepID=UPI00140E1719|nr:hypothetical protein [Motilibacter aurantiacus]NHC44645.1 hypothetical protein [Motilibacter aurantiacus]
MLAFVLTMAITVALGLAVIGFVAYPNRGRRLPGPEQVSGPLDKVGSRLSDVLDPEDGWDDQGRPMAGSATVRSAAPSAVPGPAQQAGRTS